MKTPEEIKYDLVLLDLYKCLEEICIKEKHRTPYDHFAHEIADLKMWLDKYKSAEDKEYQNKCWRIFKDKGEFFDRHGGCELMLKVCKLMGCCDIYYSGALESAWSGIGSWLA